MPQITFYRQERADGGTRTGIDVEGYTVLEWFKEGPDEGDPALVWYLDVRCIGETLPTSPDEARHWFLARSRLIRDALDSLAADLGTGIDVGPWPVQRQISGAPPGVEMMVVCSAVRRPVALSIAQVVRDLAANFDRLINELQPVGGLVP